jgi:acetyltransferase-like isoleucine patch superfamily enzyme
MQDWYRARSVVRILFTALIFELLRFTPPCEWKNVVYRWFGVNIGKNVSIAHHVVFDFLFPELITIEDGVMIGSDCEFSTHDFVRRWFAMGRIRIGRGAIIAGYTIIGPGVTVGCNAITGLRSFVKSDIPPNEFWAGTPARFKKTLSSSELAPRRDVEIIKYREEDAKREMRNDRMENESHQGEPRC